MQLCLSTQILNLHSSRNKTDKSRSASYSSHRTHLFHSLLLSSFCSEYPAMIGIHYWFKNKCVHEHCVVQGFMLLESSTNFGHKTEAMVKSFTNTGRLRMALLPKSKYHYRFGTEKDAGIRWGLRKFNVIFLLSGGKDQKKFHFRIHLCKYSPIRTHCSASPVHYRHTTAWN